MAAYQATKSLVFYSKDKVTEGVKLILDHIRNESIAGVAIQYTMEDHNVPLTIRLLGSIQEFRAEYVNSLMLLDTNTFRGLSDFNTTDRIGDPSAYGVINIGDIGLKNLSYVVKTNSANNLMGVQIEFIMGHSYFNKFRMKAPYWMYTYSAIYCNNLLEDPLGGNSHMWCRYASSEMQLLLEKVEGKPYNSFLEQVNDPQRQVVVLARIVDAVEFMWYHGVTHGDLHGMNIKILSFANKVWTKCLSERGNIGYLVGYDVPVLLDYGASSVMTQSGMLINSGSFGSHNPNYDLSKLLKWVQENGHLYTKDFTYNAFGIEPFRTQLC